MSVAWGRASGLSDNISLSRLRPEDVRYGNLDTGMPVGAAMLDV